jgi:hypothetical protein
MADKTPCGLSLIHDTEEQQLLAYRAYCRLADNLITKTL